jgi:hypothetical protein
MAEKWRVGDRRDGMHYEGSDATQGGKVTGVYRIYLTGKIARG